MAVLGNFASVSGLMKRRSDSTTGDDKLPISGWNDMGTFILLLFGQTKLGLRSKYVVSALIP